MNSLYSTIRGFSFNNIHNHDIGVVMHSKLIQPPPKKKIKVSVPFMNGSYDFSTVGSNGEMIYEERTITVVLGLPADSKEELQELYSKTLEWLVDVGKSKLIFDDSPHYYYMAEVETDSSFEQVMAFGTLTVTFVADPFKTSLDYMGFEPWDSFNFDRDELLNIQFNVIDSQIIQVYNPGRTITPTVNCSSFMTITNNESTYVFKPGSNKNWRFTLKPGYNSINVNHTGVIEFIFRKEML